MTGSSAVGTRGARRAAREERRRRRRLLVVVALVVGVLVTLAVTAYFAQRDEPLPTGTAEQSRTQRTLLLQLRGDTGLAVGSALLAADPGDRSGAGLLVPVPVLAAAPGSRSLPYAEVLSTFGPEPARKALADLLGVTVDGSWVLDLPTATRLVDALGGVSVGVDVPVVSGTTVLLQPGEQNVSGSLALALATYLAPGELEQARLARLQELLDGLLTALPADVAQVSGLLDALGSGSVLEGTDVPGVATTLVGLADADSGDALQYDSVPVVAVDTGAGVPSLRLDVESARAVVERLLAPSVPDAQRQEGNRVLVFNGVGTPMLGNAVRDALARDGLVYLPGGNAVSFGVATTEVQVPEATAEAVALGRRVAAALGVPETAVRTAQPTSVADVVVVVGADFVPPPPG